MSSTVDELARFRLDGRVAVVSGGTGGIGRRLSLALAGVGARVAILGRTADQATDLAASIEELGSQAALVTADVTNREAANRAIDAVTRRFGRLDIIINAVGGGAGTALYPAEEYPEEEWDRIMDLNLRSDLLATQAAARVMIAAGRGDACCTSHRSAANWASSRATRPTWRPRGPSTR